MSILLWVIVPYVCLAIFVVGHVWRYRYDKFGWTTRSSQLYEDRLLRWGSPLFHFGILFVAVGHFMGLVVPQSWTDRAGISHELYHLVAMAGGIPAGIATLLGLGILVYRRRTVGPVFRATTVNDKVMYAALALVIVLGIWNTVAGGLLNFGGYYNYRDGVSPWFRSIFWFQPQPELMEQAPIGFRLHALTAFLLFAMWPFTRLVHVFSAPLGYAVRPYIVYRSRDRRPGTATGSRAQKRGWEKVG
jgi:nitrate reductase gamma subunit